jgi:hypothetical protein
MKVVVEVPQSADSLERILAYCKKHEAKLHLVGVLGRGGSMPPQPAVGELLYRRQRLDAAFFAASEAARAAGIPVSIEVRTEEPAPRRRPVVSGRKAPAFRPVLAPAPAA